MQGRWQTNKQFTLFLNQSTMTRFCLFSSPDHGLEDLGFYSLRVCFGNEPEINLHINCAFQRGDAIRNPPSCTVYVRGGSDPIRNDSEKRFTTSYSFGVSHECIVQFTTEWTDCILQHDGKASVGATGRAGSARWSSCVRFVRRSRSTIPSPFVCRSAQARRYAWNLSPLFA